MPTQVLKEIKSRIDAETRSWPTLFSEMKIMVAQMLFMRTLTKDQVVAFCADMIKMYDQLSKKDAQDKN